MDSATLDAKVPIRCGAGCNHVIQGESQIMGVILKTRAEKNLHFDE